MTNHNTKFIKRAIMLLWVLLLGVPAMNANSKIVKTSAKNSETTQSLRPRGDVNCDWEVNIADVNALVDAVLQGAAYHLLYTYAHDINSDKEINIADINTLVNSILSGEPLPPMPTYSGTLPVLYINTEGHKNITSKDKADYLHADWWIDAMGIEGYQSLGSPQEPLGLLIKGRGNYTWTMSKKPFRIKLDEKLPILGMNSNKHFCLLAHHDDQYAKLKNTLGFELSRRIGLAYTPAQEPVEVVLNGIYIGLYFLTEKIRVDKKRVNIEEQQDFETDSKKISGGWLLEIDNNKNDGTIYINERNGGQEWHDWLWITSHSPEELSPIQREYITQFLTQTNAAIYTSNKNDNRWERFIDIDTLARFYIIGEIMDDTEYFSGSCYMYKNPGDTTKLIFGPVWDFGNAFQRLIYTGKEEFTYFFYQQPTYFYSHWIEEIAKFPHFQNTVRKQWKEFHMNGFNGLDIDQFIDNFIEHIRAGYDADHKRWKDGKVNQIDWQVFKFKQFLHSKIDWLQSQWADPMHDNKELTHHASL